MRRRYTISAPPTLMGARVPAKPIIPLPDQPIEYPPAEEPDTEPQEEQEKSAPPAEPVEVPAEPVPLGAGS